MAKFSTVHDADDHSAIEILGLTTAETNDTLVLAPDGVGGVEFRAEAGGGATLVGGVVTRTAGDVSTSGTTYSDVTGVSVTVTTGARRVLIGWTVTGYNNNAAGHIALCVNIDTVDQQEVLFVSQHGTASETMNLSGTWMTGVLSAASHTFKLRMRAVSAGTATLNANASQALHFWVAEQAITA